jgi:5-methyltetrahydrofolate--homocysteine methyltransferase
LLDTCIIQNKKILLCIDGVHGFGVELAEALAEMIHKQIRLDLNIASEDEGFSLRDVRMNRYQGARYSFGYPACPDLEQSKVIFELLRPTTLALAMTFF